MPAPLARSATSLPTALACSILAASPTVLSSVDAATTVLPLVSSITWAYMWLRLRKTLSLGLSGVPLTLARTLLCRLARGVSMCGFAFMSASSTITQYALRITSLLLPAYLTGLSGFAADVLALDDYALAHRSLWL